MKLIGLAGKAGSGKNTVARMIYEEFGWGIQTQEFAFAQPLKDTAVAMFGKERAEIMGGRENKEQPMGFLGNKSPREFWQLLGTEFGRDMIYQDIWVDNCFRRIDESTADLAIITDVRFDNEAEAVIHEGGEVWHVVRSDVEPVAEHSSEGGVKSHSGIEIRNDGSLADLRLTVLREMRQFWRRHSDTLPDFTEALNASGI